MEPGTEWLVWQLADSAFPLGGFAHSAGLEAAWQHGAVRHGADLTSFLQSSLEQLAHSAFPFVTAAHEDPGRLDELDGLCDAFTTNHVANRASRLQGRAFLLAMQRVFALRLPTCRHFGPLFGAATRQLELDLGTMGRLFFFGHLRGIIAAAVRLNIVGPMEGQGIQHRLGPWTEQLRAAHESASVEEVAQTAPLLDLWQGAQDRLYSRLFQS